MRPRRSGFTLVELLVVVGIIALLVTILMPSLQRAMLLARMAVCGMNLHHIYLGVRLYGEEYGVYPGARVGEGAVAFGFNQVHMTLPGQLCPEFTEDPALFWCPAEKRTLAGAPHPFFEGEGGTFGAMQYAAYKVGSPEWADNLQNRRLAWGTFGTTYAVPMNVLGHLYGLFDNKMLTQHNWWSADGAIDRESFDRNPDALYLVDKQAGIHLYPPPGDYISERHESINYLTFRGSVVRTTLDVLVEAWEIGEEPWVFSFVAPDG